MVNDQGDYRPREFGRITWLVKLAEREVGRELDRELRHTGLTKSQFGVLQALMHLERASSAALGAHRVRDAAGDGRHRRRARAQGLHPAEELEGVGPRHRRHRDRGGQERLRGGACA